MVLEVRKVITMLKNVVHGIFSLQNTKKCRNITANFEKSRSKKAAVILGRKKQKKVPRNPRGIYLHTINALYQIIDLNVVTQ